MKNQNTKTLVYTNLILLFINIFIIFLVDIMTFTIDINHRISGNGNPAIILFFILIPFILAFIYFLIVLINRLENSFFKKKSYAAILIVITLALACLQFFHAKNIYGKINEALDGFGTINQYTNTVFINGYTFLIVVFISLILNYFFKRFI